ncbi:hypothetical protein Pelo_18663 [Pelomyxa schiedti]|nr:hypothetical protein Pelo_18663 [Pelomyxa schiedti]
MSGAAPRSCHISYTLTLWVALGGERYRASMASHCLLGIMSLHTAALSLRHSISPTLVLQIAVLVDMVICFFG